MHATIFTVCMLDTMSSYGGLFHCIQCRCSVRWLLLVWAYEKTPLNHCGRYGQLCVVVFFVGPFAGFVVGNQILPMLHDTSVASSSCIVFFYLQRVFCSSSFCLIYLGRVWSPHQTGRVPLSNIRNANGR